MPEYQRAKPRLLFVHHYPRHQASSFVRQDLAILQEWCQVDERTIASFKRPFRGTITDAAMWQAVARSDAVFAWFSTCAPVLIIAALLRKPSLLIGGGADAVSMPEIGYGLNRQNRRQYFLQTLGFRLASRILPFSEASRSSILQLPGLRSTRVQTLYLGIDCDYFTPGDAKLDQVVTVGYVTEGNLRRKGIVTFVEAARLNSDIAHCLVGKPVHQHAVDHLTAMLPPNAAYVGHLTPDQLLETYRRAAVYGQLSLHEGFGMALAEAMACACVPVVTDRGAIPEVVGDTGLYVSPEDPQAAAAAIRMVIRSPERAILGRRARERIVTLFPLARRREGLQRAIEEVLS